MAEPLSIATSIITVLAAAQGVGKTLAKIRVLQHAYDEILALNNEVSDVQVLLSGVESCMLELTDTSTALSTQLHSLERYVRRTKNVLIKLDLLIQNRSIKSGSLDGQCQVSRAAWMRAKHTVKDLQQELRETRLNITAQMTLINSICQNEMRLAVKRIFLYSPQSNTDEAFSQTHLGYPLRCSSLYSLIPDASDRYLSHSMIGVDVVVPKQHGPSRLPLQKCNCRKLYNSESSQIFGGFLGRLFIGYSLYSLGTYSGCISPSCLVQPKFCVRVRYLFPWWFWGKMLNLDITATPAYEIKASLKIISFLPLDSDVFQAINHDDVEDLRQLFSKGYASPNDSLHLNGRSALGYAVCQRKFKACRFLLDVGADPFLAGTSPTSSAFDLAWDIIFHASEDPPTLEFLRSLFPDTSHLEERRLTRIHEAVLGVTNCELSRELAAFSPSQIDAQDSLGRTALSWAARRGDEEAVARLLSASASPNAVDSGGITTLHYAAQSGNSKSVELLLQAGADPNHQSSLFHEVSKNFCIFLLNLLSQSNPIASMSLLPAAPEVVFGRLATFRSRHRQVFIFTLIANYGLPDSLLYNSDVILLVALSHSDDILELLLRHRINYRNLNLFGNSILHFAAIFGSCRTVRILSVARLEGFDPDSRNIQGNTALELVLSRTLGKPDGVLKMFTDLAAKLMNLDTENRNLQGDRVLKLVLSQSMGKSDGFAEMFTGLVAGIRKRNNETVPCNSGATTVDVPHELIVENDFDETDGSELFVDALEEQIRETALLSES